MFIIELFEAKQKQVVAILPGRFQPWHKGHKNSFDYLAKLFGENNTFIATSNKVGLPKSPFDFQDKLKFITATGISPNKVVQVSSPYRAEEIVQNYDPKNTILVFGVSEKDMEEDPRFSFSPLKNGQPSYFQPYPGSLNKCKPLEKHGYIVTVPTVEFTVAGKPMRSATDFRHDFAAANAAKQKIMITDMFGVYDPKIHNILKSKLKT